MKETEIKKVVRESYAEISKNDGSCSCGCSSDTAQTISQQIGYSDEELTSVPEGANLGLGCGNPTALASLKEGETVLDLGSGAGFDCFLAANKVGNAGKIIGVDMTPEMLEKARGNAEKGGYANVEFRLGEIENLPLADNSVDVIISNCVINLSPDKERVFQEAFRVLKPGGRLMVSDITLIKELPEVIQNSVSAYVTCISGAMLKENYLAVIREAGFHKVEIVDETFAPIDSMSNDATIKTIVDQVDLPAAEIENIADTFVSIKVQGIKPK